MLADAQNKFPKVAKPGDQAGLNEVFLKIVDRLDLRAGFLINREQHRLGRVDK